MNLIEQLGGYDSAKAAALNYRNSGDALTARKFESACLEYRRANNIFDVGDFVFEVTLHGETGILVVKHIDSKIMVCENYNLNASYVLSNNSPSFYVRHATPQEIAQGYRDE